MTNSTEKHIQRLEQRVENLAREKNAAMEALGLASSLGAFDSGQGCADSTEIFRELTSRIQDLMNVSQAGVFLINDDTNDIELVFAHPQEQEKSLECEIERLIQDNSFSWALRQHGPVFFLTTDRKQEILLHVMATRTRIQGMFAALLDGDRSGIPDTALALLSVVLSSAAHALDNCQLQQRLSEINRHLEQRIEQRTRDLQEANTQLSTIIQAVPAGIVLVDADNHSIAQVNKTALDMLGESLENLMGRPCKERFCEEKQHCCPCLDGTCCPKKTDNKCEGTLRTADGDIRHVMRSTAPISLGGHRYLLDSFVDITEQKKLIKLREDVDQITRHDLKTPLNGIIALPDIILSRMDGEDEEVRSTLYMIKEAGLKMLRMINLSLDIFKMETGKYEYHPENVNIGPILRSILTELQDMSQSKWITVHILVNGEKQENADAFILRGEELLVYSLLSNLIKNALEAAPRESTVQINLHQNAHTDITIHNMGVVPQSIRDTFFEKFTTLGKKGGSGLGTYSALLIAKTMGGDISFTSSEDHGTSIRVRLPLRPETPGSSATNQPVDQ